MLASRPVVVIVSRLFDPNKSEIALFIPKIPTCIESLVIAYATMMQLQLKKQDDNIAFKLELSRRNHHYLQSFW